MTSQEKYLSEYHVTFVCSIMVSEGAREIVLMVNLLHTFLGAWAWGILLKRVLWFLKLWGTLASPRQGLQSESMSLENQNRCCPGGVRGSKCFTSVSMLPKQGGEHIILSRQKWSMSFKKAPQSILCLFSQMLRHCYWTSPARIPTLPVSCHSSQPSWFSVLFCKDGMSHGCCKHSPGNMHWHTTRLLDDTHHYDGCNDLTPARFYPCAIQRDHNGVPCET